LLADEEWQKERRIEYCTRDSGGMQGMKRKSGICTARLLLYEKSEAGEQIKTDDFLKKL
jgi:hypothetical protein